MLSQQVATLPKGCLHLFDAKVALSGALCDFVAIFIHNGGHNTEEGQRGAPRLFIPPARQGSDHVCPCSRHVGGMSWGGRIYGCIATAPLNGKVQFLVKHCSGCSQPPQSCAPSQYFEFCIRKFYSQAGINNVTEGLQWKARHLSQSATKCLRWGSGRPRPPDDTCATVPDRQLCRPINI